MLTAFRGIFPPVPTIVDAQGKLDKAGMARMIDHVLENGANGMLILGSGGEFSQFSSQQRKEIAAFCLSHVDGKVPVLVGIACAGTAETIDLGHHAQEHGADGVMVVNPYYAKLSDDARFMHYKSIADSLKIPVFLYNFPDLTGQDIGLEVITRLAREVPNIVGIKDTIDNISHTREVINRVHAFRPDFIIFSGYDEYCWIPCYWAAMVVFRRHSILLQISHVVFIRPLWKMILIKRVIFSNNWQNCLRYTHWSSLSLA